MLRGDRRRAHHDLGAVRLQHVALVLADLVRADEHALVAPPLRDQRQPHPGVARRRLHDRPARLQLTGGLGRLHHAQRDAVLHAPAGVQVLDLGEHQRRRALGHRVQLHQRRVANQVDDVLDVLHRESPFPLCEMTRAA